MIRYFILGISLFAYAYYCFTFPFHFYNDDALFFKNGIEHFSVIDFSPHFPGYPSFIFAGKFLNLFFNDATISLFVLSIISAVFIPLFGFLYAKALWDEQSAWAVFFLTLSSPFLINFALSGLSDSFGFVLLLFSFWCFQKRYFILMGCVLSLAFFARPSYAIFYVAGLVYLIIYEKEQLKAIIGSFLLVSLGFILLLFILQGEVYFIEAKRFILGHFSIWGRGGFSSFSWSKNIFIWQNLPFVLLFFHRFKTSNMLLYILIVCYAFWMLLAQNPENLRHLIPLVFLLILLLGNSLRNQKSLLTLLVVFNFFFLLEEHPKSSAIQQIMNEYQNRYLLVISNHSIEILRQNGFKVIDKYYEGRSSFYANTQKSITITSNVSECKTCKEYKGRFLGERPLYVKENY